MLFIKVMKSELFKIKLYSVLTLQPGIILISFIYAGPQKMSMSASTLFIFRKWNNILVLFVSTSYSFLSSF